MEYGFWGLFAINFYTPALALGAGRIGQTFETTGSKRVPKTGTYLAILGIKRFQPLPAFKAFTFGRRQATRRLQW
jgi:hypothetical protein